MSHPPFDDPPFPLEQGAVVTVGTFDGVHRGHQDVLARLVARAREAGLPSLIVTFEPHPLEVVNPAIAPLLLTTREEKLELLAQTGVSYLAIVPFTAALAALDAEAFVEQFLLGRYRMSELLVGYDHGFGRGRLGDVSVLVRLGRERHFGVTVLQPVHTADGHDISSTAIRRAVAEGRLDGAAEALGRPYAISGTVVSGDRRGRLLGYPTINVSAPPHRKLLPPDGVYAVRVQTPSGAFGGMLNLGPRPTFGDAARTIEAHLFDASGDWYGATVRVDFIARLRETRAFPGIEALQAQLGVDEDAARSALAVSSVAAPARLS